MEATEYDSIPYSRAPSIGLLQQSAGSAGVDQLRAKDFIPELAGDAKALLIVGKVVLQVVFLEFLVV